MLAAQLGDIAWLSVIGKANHKIAPQFKQWAKLQLKQSDHQLVLDLENSPSLDSTFLGTIANLALLAKDHGTSLTLVRSTGRALQTIRRMGIHALTEVHEDLGPYTEQHSAIQAAQKQWSERQKLSHQQRQQFILDAHRQLTETIPDTQPLFADVIKLLEQEIQQNERDQERDQHNNRPEA